MRRSAELWLISRPPPGLLQAVATGEPLASAASVKPQLPQPTAAANPEATGEALASAAAIDPAQLARLSTGRQRGLDVAGVCFRGDDDSFRDRLRLANALVTASESASAALARAAPVASESLFAATAKAQPIATGSIWAPSANAAPILAGFCFAPAANSSRAAAAMARPRFPTMACIGLPNIR